jgi:hypothetical protein
LRQLDGLAGIPRLTEWFDCGRYDKRRLRWNAGSSADNRRFCLQVSRNQVTSMNPKSSEKTAAAARARARALKLKASQLGRAARAAKEKAREAKSRAKQAKQEASEARKAAKAAKRAFAEALNASDEAAAEIAALEKRTKDAGDTTAGATPAPARGQTSAKPKTKPRPKAKAKAKAKAGMSMRRRKTGSASTGGGFPVIEASPVMTVSVAGSLPVQPGQEADAPAPGDIAPVPADVFVGTPSPTETSGSPSSGSNP